MTSLMAEKGDITKSDVDAIVNAANRTLMGGGGVDGAIHHAGGPSIRKECEAIVARQGELKTGKAVITGAGEMIALHVIHTVGPVWAAHSPEEATDLLGDCYRNSLDVALANECRTIAFPSISTGAYAFPTDLAAETAIRTVQEWVDANPGGVDQVTFVCFSDEQLSLYRAGLGR